MTADNFAYFSIKALIVDIHFSSPQGVSDKYSQLIFLWRINQQYPLIVTKNLIKLYVLRNLCIC